MTKRTEKEIFSAFIGATIDPQTFNQVAYKNWDKYMICNADYINKPQLCEIFGITDRLKWMWGYSGVDFTIYLSVEDGTIKEGHIYKAKEGCGGHGRPTSKVLSISQQELRITRRILQYITKKELA